MALNYALFLNADPPEDDNLTKDLFIDRVDEMDAAVEELLSALAAPLRKILAVVGLARMGKSHFLKMLYLKPEISDEFRCRIVLRAAQGITDERSALRLIIEQQKAQFDLCVTKLTDDERRAWASTHQIIEEILQSYGPAIGGDAVKITYKTIHTVVNGLQKQRQLSGGLSLKVGGLLAKVTGIEPTLKVEGAATKSETSSTTAGHEQTVERQIQPFSTERLRQVIELIHLLTRQCAPQWRTLLVMDDFDLLNRSGAGGSFDPIPLQNELYALSQVDAFYVLATVRMDTYGMHQKNYYPLVQLEVIQDPQVLQDIYQAHVDKLHGPAKNGPFSAAFVADAAARCEGRVGLFLESLKLAFKDRRRMDKPLEQVTFDEYLRHHWERHRRTSPVEAEILLRACSRDRGLLEPNEAVKIRNSSVNIYILDDYSSVDHVVIKPYILPFLRRQATQATPVSAASDQGA